MGIQELPKYKWGFKEVKTPAMWKAVAGEFIGTAILLFTHCQLTIRWPRFPEDGNIVQNALGTGFTVASIIEGFGHLSRAVVNPAITLSFVIARKVSPTRGLFYVLAQLLGGIAGTGLSWLVTPTERVGNFGAVFVHPDITLWQGFLMETCLTFMLAFVNLASIDDRLRPVNMPSVAVGLLVCVMVFTGATQTGACMNPAVAMGPHVILNQGWMWAQHWLYWVAPFTGSAIATVLYMFFFTWGVKSLEFPDGDKEADPYAETRNELLDDIIHAVSTTYKQHEARSLRESNGKADRGKDSEPRPAFIALQDVNSFPS
ncbi:aquaporin-4 [Lingula anatina]|uniref:Aquaporin-4 n=1 Tax=Lingula anatina TaxID=7574 RepID=A0A1S3HA81_LINAN|nr:aquaporin-4-like [Lingula anatina]XP_013383072.1 aquaporin-4 [Lingula anatina]|eukprot:XP_013382376.1 aquaporin-4-like [Lingula anatina]